MKLKSSPMLSPTNRAARLPSSSWLRLSRITRVVVCSMFTSPANAKNSAKRLARLWMFCSGFRRALMPLTDSRVGFQVRQWVAIRLLKVSISASRISISFWRSTPASHWDTVWRASTAS